MALALLIGMGTASAQQQDKVSTLMARAEKQIYGSPSSECTFVATLLDAKGKELDKYNGRIYLQGENFRLEYGDIIAVFATPTLTYHSREEETLTISTPTSEELLQINPLHFLRSKGKGFKVQSLGTKGSSEVLAYTPLGKSNIKQVNISYSTKTAVPTSAVVLSKDNSRVQIVFGDFKGLGKAYSKAFFTLSPKDFPKSEVVDLR